MPACTSQTSPGSSSKTPPAALLETLSAQENVKIALNVAGVTGRPAYTRARKLLIAAGLEERLTFRGRDLSGGQKQRVSIARAVANRPHLLLADEPTANLDSRHGREVMEVLRSESVVVPMEAAPS